MTASHWTLIVGCFALAYGPLLSIFTCVVYPKAQLVIIATTFAFGFILAATISSVVYKILQLIFQFDSIITTTTSSSSSANENTFESDYSNGNAWEGALSAIIPSVFFQFVFRCIFTSLYHKVERVIQTSLHKQQEEERANFVLQHPTHGNNAAGGSSTSAVTATVPGELPSDATTASTTHPVPPSFSSITDASKFKLALNDGSAAIAAAVGFGGMHAIVLYGTLLSSEAVNNTSGILYQNSCPYIPSLVHSAMLTHWFSLLQIFWMLLTFFGMRRRLMYHRGESHNDITTTTMVPEETTMSSPQHRPNRAGAYLGNSRKGGNYALLLTLVSHYMVALVTLYNRQPNGCYVTLPTIGAMVLLMAYLFYMGCGRIYMPVVVSTTNNNNNTHRGGGSNSHSIRPAFVLPMPPSGRNIADI
jgi:hypothetical protein